MKKGLALETTAGPSRPPRRGRRNMLAAGVATAIMLLAPKVAADSSSFPSIDFDALGLVGVVGAFSGLEIWNSSLVATPALAGQQLNPSASTLLARAHNGSLIQIGSTNSGGEIRAICQLGGAKAGVFMGGNFSEVGGVTASNVASWNPTTGKWDNIAGGIDGPIDALYCDTQHQTVVFGGAFGAPTAAANASAYLGNVALWDAAAGMWNPPDFGGLNGAVRTISPGINSSMVRFGGSFSVSFTGGQIQGVSSGVNTSASPITSGLAPLSLAQSELTGGPSSDIDGFSNPAQILCPQGSDGAGSSYLFADGGNGQLTIRTFRSIDARAFRIGNTFYQGRGTKTFNVVSIPDNTVLELIYLDPATNQNATCTTACPLAHSETIPFQDFLISNAAANNAPNGIKKMTGFQFTATDHYGDGAGLHILELLSAGSWAYAYEASNRGACSSLEVGVNGTYSQSTSTGDWYPATYSTLTGTTESYLALTDSSSTIGTDSGASVSWNVYVPITGNYSIYMQIPGCKQTSTCGQRIDVLATVMNNATNSGTPTTISQDVQDTTAVLVYDGEVQGATPSFLPSVVLSIPQNPTAPDSSSFTVVADRVNFVLRNSSFLPLTAQNSFGLFEYDLFDSAATSLQMNMSALLLNSTITPLDNFAVALRSAGVAQNSTEYVSSIASVANRTFVAGVFRAGNGDPKSLSPVNSSSSDFASIVSFTSASNGANIMRLAGGGVLGPVTGMVAVDNLIYIGGNFSSTADGQVQLMNAARYDPAEDTWASLADGLSGPVSSVSTIAKDGVLFTGHFNATGSETSTGGYAIWNTTTKAWQLQTPLVVGSISAGNGAPDAEPKSLSYFAGPISVLSTNSAPAAVTLQEPAKNSQLPVIKALNFAFDNGTGPVTNSLRRGLDHLSAFTRNLHSRQLSASQTNSPSLLPRWLQGATALVKRQDALAPPSLFSDDRNQVLATVFWQRPDGNYSQIVGGNFSTTTGINNIGIYDDESRLLTPLPGYPNSSGGTASSVSVIRSLLVVNNTLFVGGDGGMNIFDLETGAWNANIAALTATKGSASVTKLAHRPDSSIVVASGTFDSAGSLPCPSVCEWNAEEMRWIPLGTGFAGTVTDMDFASDHAGTLIVAGSLFVNGVFASLAGWSFDNATWTPYGQIGTGPDQIPGPATAVSVDDLQINSIFVAGRTTDGTKPFLVKWNGSAFQSLGDPQLLAETGVAQLTFMPINTAHSPNDVLESNRILVVSGALSMLDYGNVSSAFFDGTNWAPFLRAIDLNGQSGIVRGVTRSIETLRFPNLHRLAVGLVILISIAIGLGIVFLLVLLGLIFALTRRRSKDDLTIPLSSSDDSLGAPETKPDSLLATLNAATENVMGAGHHDAGYYSSSGYRAGGESSGSAREPVGHNRMDSVAFGTNDHSDETQTSMVYHSDGAATGRSGYYTTDSSNEQQQRNISVGAPGPLSTEYTSESGWEEMADETQGFVAHARYSFEATHPSELSVRAGQQLAILSDEDESWWLARDVNGNQGVIPATYVL
ncbi:hypothetical protein K437DRAFT_49924 [Tilletiaria anomala UBC 951]|uniref:SH3 domain-containing protein n=1 Tax=Tilletiaria anomala (strain ATCC 24038 / CBS 436.72 / UBC 951) TaxID=1037660 RepID=A0A066WCD2_TILAU|nr:uncharacterized protein K437DRAFT_49924 [Tilletiaria anomala UBC 951]KDN51381.1 hypothetical protein K437DRAFT_49924 [Tilletiaria anomala UBC 951]